MNKNCSSCNNPCGGCEPARYSNGFADCPDPWNNGNKETDTSLSIDYSGATLNYKAERHTDIIKGTQLGSIINLGDLRDVNTDSSTDAMCSELIYHRYGECGDGCRSLEDAWTRVSVDDEGILTDGMRYVRGANIYGCPQYLTVPTNTNQYWYAGWRPNGQFGYYQATEGELPKNPNTGNYIIASQDPTTKQPIVGEFPLNCILSNIMSNLGMSVTAQFSKSQEYVYIDGRFNNMTGEFVVQWEDWYNSKTRHVGTGYVNGQVLWDTKFDTATGDMVYTIRGVRYNDVTYVTHQGAPSTAAPIYLTLKALGLGDSTPYILMNNQQFNPNENWSVQFNYQMDFAKTITVTPGQTMGPFPFLYIFVDWESTFDDEGDMSVYFQNKLNGWSVC